MQRIHVALTPRDPAPADVAVVVDCIRATTTIAYALAAGYQEVVCVAEVDEARREAAALGASAVLGGERRGVRIEGFHLGNSPAEYERPLASTLVLTTTNGTRAILQAAAEAEHVLIGSLACLDRVAAAALELAHGGELAVRCAGVEGEAALDDIYVAGRIVMRAAEGANGAFLTDGARTARAVAQAYAAPLAALLDSQSARELDGTGLEPDIARCARESTLDVAPRVVEVAPGRVVVAA
jgi:2-phosphosulfolactate phosphatase